MVRDVDEVKTGAKAESEQGENLTDEGNSVSSGPEDKGSDLMRAALALILYKLGVNFYECEEASEGLAYMKKSLDLFDSLPDALKFRHLNTVQDLYNHIAII